MSTIPNWRVPKSKEEEYSLILDALLFLEKTELNSIQREIALDALTAISANNQFPVLSEIITCYDQSTVQIRKLYQYKEFYKHKVQQIKNEQVANARSAVLWENHKLVLFHMPGVCSEINPCHPSTQIMKPSSSIKDVLQLGGSILFLVVVILLIEMWGR